MTPSELEQHGLTALMEGRTGAAEEALSQAAEGYLARGDAAAAMSVLANLAFLFREQGALPRALALAEQALALGVPPADAALALVSCASVLDRAVDVRARGVWMLAAQGFTGKQPLMQVVCLAHAVGASVAQAMPNALEAARALVAQLGPTAPPSLLAGVLGAIGESAGPASVPFLAQAVWLMTQDPSAFTGATQPHWAQLVEQLGPGSERALALCALGLGASLTRKAHPDFAGVSRGVKAVFEACARARGLDADAFAALVQAHAGALEELPAALATLVPDGQWLLGTRPAAEA